MATQKSIPAEPANVRPASAAESNIRVRPDIALSSSKNSGTKPTYCLEQYVSSKDDPYYGGKISPGQQDAVLAEKKAMLDKFDQTIRGGTQSR